MLATPANKRVLNFGEVVKVVQIEKLFTLYLVSASCVFCAFLWLHFLRLFVATPCFVRK
jgi:hypothetical protein